MMDVVLEMNLNPIERKQMRKTFLGYRTFDFHFVFFSVASVGNVSYGINYWTVNSEKVSSKILIFILKSK